MALLLCVAIQGTDVKLSYNTFLCKAVLHCMCDAKQPVELQLLFLLAVLADYCVALINCLMFTSNL